MLVLKRKIGEGQDTIDIGLGTIIVKVLKVTPGGVVSIGVEAPTDIPVHRGEILQASQALEKVESE